MREFLVKVKNAENDLDYNENSLLLHIAQMLAGNIGSTGVYVQGGELCFSIFAPPVPARSDTMITSAANNSSMSLWRNLRGTRSRSYNSSPSGSSSGSLWRHLKTRF